MALVAVSTGCSSKTETANQTPSPVNVAVESSPAPIDRTSNAAPATEVVSQFLDLVRRGGVEEEINALLTEKARRVIATTGHRLQPIGSPAAKFEVTRAENVPDSPGSALVHTFWSEPAESVDGDDATSNATTYGAPMQVVWAVQRERSAWRISGVAVQTDASAQLVVLDFENPTTMAAYLGDEETTRR